MLLEILIQSSVLLQSRTEINSAYIFILNIKGPKGLSRVESVVSKAGNKVKFVMKSGWT